MEVFMSVCELSKFPCLYVKAYTQVLIRDNLPILTLDTAFFLTRLSLGILKDYNSLHFFVVHLLIAEDTISIEV